MYPPRALPAKVRPRRRALPSRRLPSLTPSESKFEGNVFDGSLPHLAAWRHDRCHGGVRELAGAKAPSLLTGLCGTGEPVPLTKQLDCCRLCCLLLTGVSSSTPHTA